MKKTSMDKKKYVDQRLFLNAIADEIGLLVQSLRAIEEEFQFCDFSQPRGRTLTNLQGLDRSIQISECLRNVILEFSKLDLGSHLDTSTLADVTHLEAIRTRLYSHGQSNKPESSPPNSIQLFE